MPLAACSCNPKLFSATSTSTTWRRLRSLVARCHRRPQVAITRAFSLCKSAATLSLPALLPAPQRPVGTLGAASSGIIISTTRGKRRGAPSMAEWKVSSFWPTAVDFWRRQQCGLCVERALLFARTANSELQTVNSERRHRDQRTENSEQELGNSTSVRVHQH